jgi:hypothetical protein
MASVIPMSRSQGNLNDLELVYNNVENRQEQQKTSWFDPFDKCLLEKHANMQTMQTFYL